MSDQTMVFDTPDGIEYFKLASAKQMIKLQAKGMTHSSGRNVKALWAKHFGMSARATPEAVIERIELRMNLIMTAKQGGITAAQLRALCDYAVKHGKDWNTTLLDSFDIGEVSEPNLVSVITEKGEKWVRYLQLDITVIP